MTSHVPPACNPADFRSLARMGGGRPTSEPTALKSRDKNEGMIEPTSLSWDQWLPGFANLRSEALWLTDDIDHEAWEIGAAREAAVISLWHTDTLQTPYADQPHSEHALILVKA
jgi:hypothetical protein